MQPRVASQIVVPSNQVSRVAWEKVAAPPTAAPRPHFTEEVENQTVVVGRDGTMRCSVKNLGSHQIAWMKADTQTLLSISNTMISRNYRIRVRHSDNTTWFLHLENVNLTDRGNYMCQINTVPPISKQGYLEVVVPPEILDEETSTDVEVKEDAPAQLRCGAKGYPAPEIKFTKERGGQVRYATKGMPGAVPSSTTVDEDGLKRTTAVLAFNTVTRGDMGHYLCIASNGVPPTKSKRMVLNVRYREPAVFLSHQMIGAYLGDSITINCSVTAYPRPVVFWQDSSGKMIISGGRFRVKETQVGYSTPEILTMLTISDITQEDFTTYRCNASIDNDKTREKSLAVELNEISRPSTESSVIFKVAHQPKNLQKSLSKQKQINEIGERYEKPTKLAPGFPDIFSQSSHGHLNYNHGPPASSSDQSKSSAKVIWVLAGWWLLGTAAA
ncbi:protein amalgam-like [Eriocheir sinensis]|uniref:protein amalgam-like n=1 Tax=Eriocheir sinensis TaxID=95602 RepID=UPI0021C89F94|nr:protein amalgam-like [Eriocheir sinensis]